jgi:hypothetical protein
LSKNAPGCGLLVSTQCVAFRWFKFACDIDRTIASRRAIVASRGKCSQMVSPGTSVAIDLNSPRMPSGASGFMSNVSMWLGAPVKKTRMTDFARGFGCTPCDAATAARPATSDEVPTPRNPENPTCKNSRRTIPIPWRWGIVIVALRSETPSRADWSRWHVRPGCARTTTLNLP